MTGQKKQKHEIKRDSKGRFTSKKKECLECPLKKIKEKINKNTDLIIAVVILWIIFTGAFWMFAMKTTYPEVCANRSSFNYLYNATTHGISAEWYNYEYCYNTPAKSYYSLPEVLGVQGSWVMEQPGNIAGVISGFVGWLGSHPVIK